jgi:hypothetical protein
MTVRYTLVQPVKDNKAYLGNLFPKTPYLGDVGDTSHLSGGSGDHTPWSSDKINGVAMKRGWIYAQDLGNSAAFDLRRFSAWLLTSCAAGKYREVKYVICRVPGSGLFHGAPVYGLYDRRYSWRRQTSSGHDHHIHISYMPGFENARSTIVADYHAAITRTVPKAAPYPIRAETFFKGQRIGSPVPNARALTADRCPRLTFGAGDKAMGGWVTYAENKLGVSPNGYFGMEMVAATQALQRRKGYPVTGSIGPAEWNSLGQPNP